MITKTRVFLLLAVIGIAYGGLKGYIWFKTKSRIDDLATTMAPFADLKYGSVSSTLGGAVRIDDIVVRPITYNDTVNIERVNLQTPGLGFLLNGGKAVRNGELPEHLSLELQNVRFSLNGDLIKALEEMEIAGSENQPATQDSACTLSRTSVTDQYRQLDVKEIAFDATASIDRDETPSEVRVSMSYNLHGIEEGRFAVTLDGVGHTVYSTAASTPLLIDMQAHYKPDPAFVEKMLEYCAEQNGTDIPTFIDRLFNKSDNYYATELGFIPGPGIRDALKQLIATRGELRVTADPLSPVDLSTVHLYKQKDWPGLFGLSAFVNESPVTDLSFRIPEQNTGGNNPEASLFSFAQPAKNGPDNKTESDAKQSPPATRQREKEPSLAPRLIDKDDIHDFVGQNVKIVTNESKTRSGTVLKVENGLVHLKRQFSSGTLSTRVPLESVRQVEVMQ